ncbi:hypothetical protein [Streptomyces sp. NPDC059593]|uniref:hypothetical protein n=1 Tax=Streptomyces sp. NPDC059593 TaxID=3346878 RepID=UPI0036CA4990
MSRPIPRSITVSWKSETIVVSNVGPTLPAAPDEAAIRTITEVGASNPEALLPEGAWEAVGRATTKPDGLALQLRPTAGDPGGLLMAENVDGATLRSVVTQVHHNELLPGIQPRTGMESMETPDPQVRGITDEGRPCATVQYLFKNLDHLRDHTWQTINGTLSINNYSESILARKVTRNLITHPVLIAFEDGTDPFYALVVRDGITRLASSWSVLAGPEAETATAANLAVESLFGRAGAPVPTGVSLSRHLADVREKARQSLRDEFTREMNQPEPGLLAAQIAQTSVLPAQIAVGVEGHPGHLLAPDDIFDDAIRSVLASVHVEFKPWDDAAQNVEVATRALQRVIQQGDSLIHQKDLQAIYGLAVGRIPVTELPQLFSSDASQPVTPPPATALWRAVYLVHALTRPELMDRVKDQAKAIKGGKRMGLKGFSELLGPIVDQPWRSYKKHVTKQARNAWNNGGVLTSAVVGEWDPVPTEDFTTLIAPALAGDDNARCTLAVAGGVALIADKLLTRNVGSALLAAREKGGVPFRADVNQIIEDLSKQDNELGLWTLALAANRFRSDALPENAVTMRQLFSAAPQTTSDPYIHLKVDLDAADKEARGSDGMPEMLHQWDVVWASNPTRAAKQHPPKPPTPETTSTVEAEGGSGDHADGTENASGDASADGTTGDDTSETADTRPPSQRAADHRHTLRESVNSARDALDRLHGLEPQVGGHTPIVPLPVLDELHVLLIGLQTDVENLRRRITTVDDLELEDAEQL